MDYDDFIKM
jgi:hypothetical protein